METARDAGCPRDQIERLLLSGIVLQPRQFAASAAARLCDRPNGPTDILYGGARGGGKAGRCPDRTAPGYNSDVETKILTPTGFKLLGDVRVGDSVCNPDGTVARVIAVHEQGLQQFYRVTLLDGSTVEASEGHLWAIRIANARKRRKIPRGAVLDEMRPEDEWNLRLMQDFRIVTTAKLAELVERAESDRGAGTQPRSVLLPLSAPVCMTGAPGRWPVMPPYTLGVLIGDGHLAEDAVTFTCADEGIVERMRAELGDRLRVVCQTKTRSIRYRVSSTPGDGQDSPQALLRRDGLLGSHANDKFVPERIKKAPVEVRFEFLRGLFDTDGHMDARGHVEFTTVSDRLARDVQWLARSLGFKATLGTRTPTYTHLGQKRQGQTAYRLHIRGPRQERLFGLARKADRAKGYNGTDDWPGHRVVRVERAGVDIARCITVDNPNSLYVTDDFIVTHNSHWGMAQVVADDMQRAPFLKALILRQVGKAARESVEDLRMKVLSRIPHKWASHSGTLTLPNGSRAIVGHFKNERDVDAYLGLEYDVILVEEATTLTATKRRYIRTCCRNSRTDFRPRMYNTTNPGGVGHASVKATFVEPYRKGNETGTRFVPATVDDNRFVDPDYREKLEALVGWERKAWLEGDWDIAAGQFFTNFRRGLHVLPESRMPRLPLADEKNPKRGPAWPVWCALDYGFTHYTTCYLMTQNGDGDVYALDEHAQRRWLPPRHVDAITAMLARHGLELHHLRRFVAGADVFTKDRHGRTTADTYKELGIEFHAAHDDRINGASEILSRLGDLDASPIIVPRLFISERCTRLIECLPALEHDPHRPEDVLKVDVDDDGSGGDDAYDGFRYGVMEAYTPPRARVDRASARRERFGYA